MQRNLLKTLLAARYGILGDLICKHILEDADGAVHIYDLKGRLLLRNLEDEDLLEPVIGQLPSADHRYLLYAVENKTFDDAAGEAIYSIGVEFEGSSLTEVEKAEAERF